MSSQNPFETSRFRNRILASAAAIALVAAGAIGEGALTVAPPAKAAAISTANLPAQNMPSFASLIERVKPAVVSIRVKTVNASDFEQLERAAR